MLLCYFYCLCCFYFFFIFKFSKLDKLYIRYLYKKCTLYFHKINCTIQYCLILGAKETRKGEGESMGASAITGVRIDNVKKSRLSCKLGLGGGFPLTLSDAKATWWSRRRWQRHAPLQGAPYLAATRANSMLSRHPLETIAQRGFGQMRSRAQNIMRFMMNDYCNDRFVKHC